MNTEKSVIPKISVGMPVYNGSKHLKAAIESILSQTFPEFELIISDNASTDETEKICKQYAAADSRIRYIRQDENIGASKNFNFVFSKARAKYFMWAACDDLRSPNFLECNYAFLENNPDYVVSTSPTRFENENFNPVSMGDAALNGNLPERLLNFFNTWHANARFYGLMKTDTVRSSSYLKKDFLGSDWAIMLEIITHGKINRHEEGYVILGKQGLSQSGTIFKYYRKQWIDWIIPFSHLINATVRIIKPIPFLYKIRIMRKLIYLNYQAFDIIYNTEIKQCIKNLIYLKSN